MESNTGQVINLGSWYHQFERLRDKRKAKGKWYALATILLGMFLAKLCGVARDLDCTGLRSETEEHAQPPYLSTDLGGSD